MSCGTKPVDSRDWYAYVKYKGYNDTEIVPVEKISLVKRARDGRVLRFEAYQPLSLDDIDKSGYNYHVKTKKNTVDGQEERFYATIGALGRTKGELETRTARIRFPGNLPEFSDTATEDTAEESDGEDILEKQRSKNLQKNALTMQSTQATFQKLLESKRLQNDSANAGPKRRRTDGSETDMPPPLPQHDVSSLRRQDSGFSSTFSEPSTAESDDSSSETACMKKKIEVLESQLCLLRKDLKDIIGSAVKEFIVPTLSSIETRIGHVEGDVKTNMAHFEQTVAQVQRKIDAMSNDIKMQSLGSSSSILSVSTELEAGAPILLEGENGESWECTRGQYVKLALYEKSKAEWCNALLSGAFPGYANEMRVKPTKRTGKLPFPQAFLSAAAGLYAQAQIRQGRTVPEAVALSRALPAYLSDRCQEMDGARGKARKQREDGDEMRSFDFGEVHAAALRAAAERQERWLANKRPAPVAPAAPTVPAAPAAPPVVPAALAAPPVVPAAPAVPAVPPVVPTAPAVPAVLPVVPAAHPVVEAESWIDDRESVVLHPMAAATQAINVINK